MKKVNVAYVISFVDKSSLFEWTARMLDKNKINLFFILLNPKESSFDKNLKDLGLKVFRVDYKGKKDMFKAILSIARILKQNKTDIVHAHLFDACIAGLIAARLVGVKKRIHTRHNATLHHDYHPGAVKYDKLINYLSTDIIAISENVKRILVHMEGVDEKKIHLIHHGFNLNEFNDVSIERINKIKNKYLLNNIQGPIIGVVSRYIEWKGVQYIIPAFVEFYKKYPTAHFVFANASGPYSAEIKKLLEKLPENSFTEIQFEEDIPALYKTFDAFVHVPIDEKSEAYGQVYVESMAAGIATIVTLSGIASEFVVDKQNALVVPYKDSKAIFDSLMLLLSEKSIRDNITLNGKKDVFRLFTIDKMIQKTEMLYER